jgi:hypothetical protein
MLKPHKRIIKMMKIIEIHMRIKKIIKIKESCVRIIKKLIERIKDWQLKYNHISLILKQK